MLRRFIANMVGNTAKVTERCFHAFDALIMNKFTATKKDLRKGS